jgi:DNA repair protein RadC
MHGAATLSNADLLAILINTGTPGESVTSLAQRIINEFGGLRGLMRADITDIRAVKGLGPAKAAHLVAALELANRVVALGPDERPRISTPEDALRLVGPEMGALDVEQLRVILVDTKHRVLGTKTVYQGTANQAQVRVAEVFRDAIRHNATGIVVVHNHPSGDSTPSAADISLTAELDQAGRLLGIDLLDHLIVSAHNHTSLRRLNLGFSTTSTSR